MTAIVKDYRENTDSKTLETYFYLYLINFFNIILMLLPQLSRREFHHGPNLPFSNRLAIQCCALKTHVRTYAMQTPSLEREREREVYKEGGTREEQRVHKRTRG